MQFQILIKCNFRICNLQDTKINANRKTFFHGSTTFNNSLLYELGTICSYVSSSFFTCICFLTKIESEYNNKIENMKIENYYS